MNDYQTLMSALHNAHQDFQKKFQKWKDGESLRAGNLPANIEPLEVTDARRRFWEVFNRLFEDKLNPLDARFKINPASAVDEVIDFLAVDIPAFRCGIYKEFFLRRLKDIKMSAEQEKRLLYVFFKLCKSRTMPREFQSWCELILSFSDLDIVDELTILTKSPNNYAKTKSTLMMEMIFKDRRKVPNYS